jgi:predicted transcriptional regulator
MNDYRVGSVVIMKQHKPVGIITDGDIVWKVAAKNKEPSKVLAKNAMSSPLKCISDEKDVNETASILRKDGIKRLGVMDDKDQLVGIISISDIVSAIPEMYAIVAEKSRLMASQSVRRQVNLAGFCDSCDQWSDNLVRGEGKFLCYDCRAESVAETSENAD